MKKIWIVTILLLISTTAFASVLPSASEIYGEYIPAMEFAIGRQPDSEETSETGLLQVWNNFSEADYLVAGRYFAACGCTVSDWKKDGIILQMTVSKGDNSLTLCYDRAVGNVAVNYPKGTRPEETATEVVSVKESAFPPLAGLFSVEMPGFEIQPASITVQDDNTIYEYVGVTDREFENFGRYAGSLGCMLTYLNTEKGVLEAKLEKQGTVVTLRYDSKKDTTELVYTSTALIKEDTPQAYGESVLPDLSETLGIILPSVSMAIKRAPDREETVDGITMQLFEQFTDVEYGLFSQYLNETGTELIGYTADGKQLVIEMKKEGVGFTFTYLRAEKQAKLVYPEQSRMQLFIPD